MDVTVSSISQYYSNKGVLKSLQTNDTTIILCALLGCKVADFARGNEVGRGRAE